MFLLGFLSELLNSFFSVMGLFLVLRKCSLFLISFLAGRRRDVPRTCEERCHDEVSPYVPSSYILSGFFTPLHDLSPWTFCPDQDYFLLRVSSIYTVLYRYSKFCFWTNATNCKICMGFQFCKVGMFLALLLECSQLVLLCAKKGSVCVCSWNCWGMFWKVWPIDKRLLSSHFPVKDGLMVVYTQHQVPYTGGGDGSIGRDLVR